MKKIKLTQGKFALVDDEDFERLSKFKWCFGVYARRNFMVDNKQVGFYMHWDIVGKPLKGMVVDHINGNELDNRRSNLRICTYSENNKNFKVHREGRVIGYTTKKYKGNTYYQAQKLINGKVKYLGLFPTPELAHQKYLES